MGFTPCKEKFWIISAIDGVKPTRENILNGTYKFAATYYLTLPAGLPKEVENFVEFVRSEKVSQLLPITLSPCHPNLK